MSEVLKIRAKKNTCARLFALDWIRYATTIRQKRFRVTVSVGVRNLVVVIWSYKLLQVSRSVRVALTLEVLGRKRTSLLTFPKLTTLTVCFRGFPTSQSLNSTIGGQIRMSIVFIGIAKNSSLLFNSSNVHLIHACAKWILHYRSIVAIGNEIAGDQIRSNYRAQAIVFLPISECYGHSDNTFE